MCNLSQSESSIVTTVVSAYFSMSDGFSVVEVAVVFRFLATLLELFDMLANMERISAEPDAAGRLVGQLHVG